LGSQTRKAIIADGFFFNNQRVGVVALLSFS